MEKQLNFVQLIGATREKDIEVRVIGYLIEKRYRNVYYWLCLFDRP